MEKSPLPLTLRYPETEEELSALRAGVARLHAEYVLDSIAALACPQRQKLELLARVAQAVRQRT